MTILRILSEGGTLKQAAASVEENTADCAFWVAQHKAAITKDAKAEQKKYPSAKQIYLLPAIGISADAPLVEPPRAAKAFSGVRFSDAQVPPDALRRIDIPPTIHTGHCGASETSAALAGARWRTHA